MKCQQNLVFKLRRRVKNRNGAPGLETVLNRQMQTAKSLILFILYLDLEPTRFSNAQCDRVIRRRYAEGESISDLARSYRISPQRVFQIVRSAWSREQNTAYRIGR